MTHIKALLFDFFGTLVEYQPDRSRLGSPRAYQRATELGYAGGHDAFVREWDTASRELERVARSSLREFSMTDAAAAFCAATELILTDDEIVELGTCFVREWAQHVVPIDGVAELIRGLALGHTVAVVSNTHDRSMVPTMLAEMGIDSDVSAVLLSVEHGWLKPHPSIYDAALTAVGCAAEDVVFIGDSFEADYAGPVRAGMHALLIDPNGALDAPPQHRLNSVLDVAQKVLDLNMT